jgi:hypothetical protein
VTETAILGFARITEKLEIERIARRLERRFKRDKSWRSNRGGCQCICIHKKTNATNYGWGHSHRGHAHMSD